MHDVTDISFEPAYACISDDCTGAADFMKAGAGSLVVLVHSSMTGAGQWSVLIRDLKDRALVRAVTLFGYGSTPACFGYGSTPGGPKDKSPSPDDLAQLVTLAVPSTASNVSTVDHSFGGAIAMQAAAPRLREKVKNLVLIEPSLVYLLDCCDRRAVFHEISTLAKYTKRCISDEIPEAAAEGFIAYWCGPGTWAASSPDGKSSFARSITVLPREWDGVLGRQIAPADWAAALPRHTLLMSAAKTAGPSRELVEVLMHARLDWELASICKPGHMAPLTHPQLANPIITGLLTRWASTASDRSSALAA